MPMANCLMAIQILPLMSPFKTIAVIGAGSWGTALAILLAGKGHSVRLWGHNRELLDQLKKHRENRRYLPGVVFPPAIEVVSSLERAVEGTGLLVMVVPSHAYRQVFEELVPHLAGSGTIVSAAKGIENSTLMTMTAVMDEVLGREKGPGHTFQLGVLSGPSFAEEVARGVPTAVTVGFAQLETAKQVQEVFVTETFRVYASQDVVGLEISAAVKNVIAIAAGVCDGLGYGLNTRAALITRGLAEMKRLGIALGAEAKTFSGLSGLGDLLLTCTGNLSRNRTVGLKLGSGQTLAQITQEMTMVAEGVRTTKSLYNLARQQGVEMPILEQVYRILYAAKPCSLAVKDLLARELKVE
jgi:glycerol-3-phosphate dehydrogenase (NAD(P)+)